MQKVGRLEKVDWLNPILFLLFVLSGFCSLVYQIVWLRLAFAHFGIVTPVLSLVLSVFMLGLGAGSLLGGRWASTLSRRLGVSPAVLYGAAELVIGLGAVMVPAGFDLGEMLLLRVGAAGSVTYLLLSAIAIGVVILPWSIMMGATFPLMMAFVRSQNRIQMQSFSFLYLANVMGAMLGALLSAVVLIELLGFRRTSLVAAALNACIAAASFTLSRVRQTYVAFPATLAPVAPEARPTRWRELVLFTTGFCSLAMEVVWTRGFTIILLTTIYAFAAILATYLGATWVGSAVYRLSLRYARVLANEKLLALSAACALLPLVLDDPRVQSNWMVVLAGIVPLCATLGYLTPKLVDEYSGGDPRLAGRCYAINILGSILGPLFAGYVLVVVVGVRLALAILALPLCMLAAVAGWRTVPTLAQAARLLPIAVLLGYAVTISRSYEEWVGGSRPREVHRDYAATAIAYGNDMGRQLVVNGIKITGLTPTTKMMAHLPLALQGHAHDGLVICFGMGTTFRSMVSWGINTTVVDLTRAVVDSFGFFHKDANAVLASPNAHVVIDDGRRFLQRTDQMFDVITIDPPPPVEAAGSSLLYSTDFYEVAKRHLRPDGILQQWIPEKLNQTQTSEAIARSLMLSFPYVVAFPSFYGGWGTHFLVSLQPIPKLTADEFVARMPRAAQLDLREWDPANTSKEMATMISAHRVLISEVAPAVPASPAITDDRPFNEYFLLRRWLSRYIGFEAWLRARGKELLRRRGINPDW
jgi:spermidine synthase